MDGGFRKETVLPPLLYQAIRQTHLKEGDIP